MDQTNHWTILGAGAIGSLWAAYWREDACPVTLISHHPAKKRTLTLNNNGSKEYSVDVTTSAALDTNIDRLLITTKAHQTVDALSSIKDKINPGATIVILQNGMAATELSFSSQQKVFAATTTDGAYCESPLNVTHAGKGKTLLGAIDPTNSEQANQLIRLLPSSLNISVSENITEKLRQKLAINCAINGLTVKYQCRNGELLSNQQAYQELTALCEEISFITARLEWGLWFEALQQEVEQVLELTAENINSMLQDYQRKKPTEIIQLNGYLYQQAQSLNIPCPLNRAITNFVQRQTA
jgi:2-dehydropantoate 2-reductase